MLGSAVLVKCREYLNLRKKVKMIVSLDYGSITVGFNQIKLPRIGWMKTYEVLPDNVTPCGCNYQQRI